MIVADEKVTSWKVIVVIFVSIKIFNQQNRGQGQSFEGNIKKLMNRMQNKILRTLVKA